MILKLNIFLWFISRCYIPGLTYLVRRLSVTNHISVRSYIDQELLIEEQFKHISWLALLK